VRTIPIALGAVASLLAHRGGGRLGDEALALSQEILDHFAPSPVTRLCPQHRIGVILARRGDPRAGDYVAAALAAADMTGEPQHIVPVRLSRAEGYWLEGRRPTPGARRWRRGIAALAKI
jgi:hypothetical protein